jgi:outer membrane protein
LILGLTLKDQKKLTDASEADFAYAQQNLIIRTVEKYFGVLRAIDNLNAAVSEEKAIKKQLDQIQQRFEVGLSAITEVQEAQLAYDLSVAAKIRSEGALFNAREELNSLIGREIFSIDSLKADIVPENPNPTTKQEWVDIALKNNYRLQASVLRRDASQDSARSSASEHLPKINIVGTESESNTNQYAYEGFEDLGFQAPSETQRKNYSLSLSIPISQGGAVSSRRRQAYAEYNRAVEETLFAQRTVIQEVRSGFSNVITLGANLKAQKQAVVSANSALEATRVGYEVGTRNIVDLLQAEKNLYTAEKNLANAKYDYLLSQLNLQLAAGTLSPQSINEINGYLN